VQPPPNNAAADQIAPKASSARGYVVAVLLAQLQAHLKETPQRAKDFAGTLGNDGFSWGRFAFQAAGDDGGGPMLAAARKVLR